LKADFVSLQTAIVGTNNRDLADIFRLNLDSNGFFSESPEKLKPIHSSARGIYMAGLAVYPIDTNDSITQAKAASAGALEILSRDTIQVGGQVARFCLKSVPRAAPASGHAPSMSPLLIMKGARPLLIPVFARDAACAWRNVPARQLLCRHAVTRC
jgi:hypothetical protein